jgi:hypothetical protein
VFLSAISPTRAPVPSHTLFKDMPADHLCRANERTLQSNKKTIMPADVFAALEEIEFGFMRDQLEAEFASSFSLPTPTKPPFSLRC